MLDDADRPLGRREVQHCTDNGIGGEGRLILLFNPDTILKKYNYGVSRSNNRGDFLRYGTWDSFTADNDIVERRRVCRHDLFAASHDIWPEMDALAEDRGIDNEAIFLCDVVVGPANSSGGRCFRQ